MDKDDHPVQPWRKRESGLRRTLRIASWVPELLIDPLHIVEGTVAFTRWIARLFKPRNHR